MTGKPDIDVYVSYEGRVPPELFDEFQRTVASEGLAFALEQRPSVRAYAAVEWLMPTAIIVYVAKSYFDSFLKEMGKDHYQFLKNGIKTLQERLSHVKVNQVGTPDKVTDAQPYSLIYSIYFDRGIDGNFKFLIPTNLSPDDASKAMDTFFDFLEDYYAGSANLDALADMAAVRPLGRTVLLAYNPAAHTIEVVDPIAVLTQAK